MVKVNAPQLLRAKLATSGWTGEHIAMGTNVDCYQRAEGRYRLMRGIIEVLRDAANPFSILTKGTLILRDLDLLLEAAAVTEVGLNVSAGFVDEALWRAIEPGTPAPRPPPGRLRGAQRRGAALRGADGARRAVPVGLPRPARGGGAAGGGCRCGAHVMPIVLHLRPGAREWFLRWLGEAHPELMPRYAELYGRGAYARKDYQARITGQVRELAERFGVGRQGTPRGQAARGQAARVAPAKGGQPGREAGRHSPGAARGGPRTAHPALTAPGAAGEARPARPPRPPRPGLRPAETALTSIDHNYTPPCLTRR